MAIFQIYKETVLPGVLEAHSIYAVAPAAQPDYVELYITNALGVARRMLTGDDIQSLIDASLASAGSLIIVADIAERDALVLTGNTQVLVIDASSDPTVTSGSATYVYDFDNTTWIKTGEYESMDVVVNWDNIVGKPTSTPTQIDTAVANSHTHANKTELDKVGEDGDANFTYDGSLPVIAWASEEW